MPQTFEAPSKNYRHNDGVSNNGNDITYIKEVEMSLKSMVIKTKV